MWKRWKNRKFLIGALALIWLVVCVVLTPIYTTVTVCFEKDPSGEYITTVFAGPGENIKGSEAKSRVINSGISRISFLDIQYGKHCSLKRIDPLDRYYNGEPLTISEITVRQNGIKTISLGADVLQKFFSVNDHMVLLEKEDFAFEITGDDPQLIPTAEFQKLYSQNSLAVILLGWLISGIVGMFLLYLLHWFSAQIKEYTVPAKIAYWIFLAGLFGAAVMCVYVGLRSPFWLNPDEYDVKAAVQYYFTHFMPPDIRTNEITDSFPVYGTSRHFEFNMFYFYAGKLGQLFADPAMQLRMFTLILFCLMVAFIIKNMKKHYALLFVLLLTPQIWYIFSYSTSDALDFFVGFLSLYQVIEENSMLNRLLREKFCKRHLISYVLISVLFVHIFWSKASFYPILVFLFLILLIRMLYQEKEERKKLLQKYLILVGLTLGIFAVRYMITDFPYYGFNKLGVIIEVTELRADYGYKPSTPPLLQAPSMSFFGKGITLGELLTQYEFNKNTFRTFAGFFGTYTFGEGNWYYWTMGILYILLLCRLSYTTIKMKNSQKNWELAAVGFTCFLQYALIIFNSWFVDFQPQGRYLLPVVFFISYMVSRQDHAKDDKFLRGILVCTCVLSLFCFWHVGIPNLVPNTFYLP